MFSSESYQGLVTTIDNTKITGITYYAGDKGDELSDYTHNVKLGQRTNVKSTSIFFYNDATTRASGANPVSDRMFSSESYQGEVTDIVETALTGITYYVGDKGDELSDYTHNVKLGQRDTVKSTSIFFYNDATTRAIDANPVSDRMFSSESYQGLVTTIDNTKITGITYYAGDKGDELSDYTHNVKLGQRTNVKSTSIFFYNDAVTRAVNANPVSDRMFSS